MCVYNGYLYICVCVSIYTGMALSLTASTPCLMPVHIQLSATPAKSCTAANTVSACVRKRGFLFLGGLGIDGCGVCYGLCT